MQDFLQKSTNKYRLSQREKDANDHRWYREYCDALDRYSFYDDRFFGGFGDGTSSFKQKKVNYDLFNNIIDKNDFKYVYKPFGEEVGELPANMTNRDIVSSKIKVLLGMEMSMPFSWKVVAVNSEATTRKEQQELKMLKDYVTSEIMMPIKQQIEIETQQQAQGRKLSQEEQVQLRAQVESETKRRTPEEVKKYMAREHQDPAEVLGSQILEYLTQEERIPDKFNKGFKHLMLGGKEVYRIDIVNGDPTLTTVNALFFDHDQSPELETIEDGSWAVAEYRMTPNQVLTQFGSVMKDKDIDKVYSYEQNRTGVLDTDFTFSDNGYTSELTVRVLHTVWKAPMKVQFLTFFDEEGQVQEKVVNEDYRLTLNAGDIAIETLWVPETHECWKIMDDIYLYPRAVPGQNKDLDNLWKSKLPYYGASVDNLNSPITSPMERIKGYQYYFDIILYRIELLMASDKGKKLAMNINTIPKTAGIDTKQWLYFFEANSIAFINPKEEGNKGSTSATTGDITNLVKEIDMSMAAQIQNYINLAEYIETKCGAAIGVTKQMEGAIGPTEAVTNTKQNLIQSSYITRPYFELHNQVKRNVLQGLIEIAKVAYVLNPKKKLHYVLDDMSVKLLSIDAELLDNSTYGLYVTNSSKSEEIRQAMVNLSHAALQNDQATLLDIANILESNSVTEAKEMLAVSQQNAQERAENIEKMKADLKKQEMAAKERELDAARDHEEKMIVLKAREDRATKVQVQTIASMGFDLNKDEDADTIPDVLEVAKYGVDAEIKRRKADVDERGQQLEERKFEHDTQEDKFRRQYDKEKLAIERKKANKPTSSK